MALNYFTVQHFGAGLENGLLMYRPSLRRQHGFGIGSFLSSMFQRLIPIARNIVLPHALGAIRSVASDFSEGRDIKESLKSNAVEALKGVGRDLISQTGSGSRRGKKRKNSSVKKLKSSKKIKIKKTGKKRSIGRKKSQTKKIKRRKTLKKSDFITLFD